MSLATPGARGNRLSSAIVTLEGHLIDSLMLPRVFDEIIETGSTYEIVDLTIGVKHEDPSFARIKVTASNEDDLERLIERLRPLGANPEQVEDAVLAEADIAGAFPPGFYSTTSFRTEIRVAGTWIEVDHPEMDCGVVVTAGGGRTIPMDAVEPGMSIVMSGLGIRVTPPEKPRGTGPAFGFMSSEISSEKPKSLLLDQVAEQMRKTRADGKRIMWVVGPAIVHTGAGPDLSRLIKAGYVQALFAGNGVAAHDIESHMFGTSLGVYLEKGIPAEHGHDHHIRAINEVRRAGSLAAAVDAGLVSDGIVFNLVRNNVAFLFGGSVRDDGPLPDVVTDMPEVQRKLREMIWGPGGDDLVGMCVVAGTMLHGIATSNCLPADVPLVCVDMAQSTVTKLMDRGSFASKGIITDAGLFVGELAERLAAEDGRS